MAVATPVKRLFYPTKAKTHRLKFTALRYLQKSCCCKKKLLVELALCATHTH